MGFGWIERIKSIKSTKPKLRRQRMNPRETFKELKHERGLYGNYYKSPKNNDVIN